MKSNSQKRLLIDLKKLLNDAPQGIEAAPVDHNDIFLWEAVIIG
jgi:ubiquitin-protein ligase